MKVLIIGSGRMGIRHAQGLFPLNEISSIVMTDANKDALDNAQSAVRDAKVSFCMVSEIERQSQFQFDICIIASTASDRLQLIKLAQKCHCKNILIEKPLGQSIEQVMAIDEYIKDNGLNCSVNLNMRLYKSFIELKQDLEILPQLIGEKTISINTGTLGIGANGIHYLDLLFFLLDANDYKLVSGEVDEILIPSGRGSQFGDFGGWAVIKFYRNEKYVGKALIAMSSSSTVFGSWEIVAPHGRIYLNEVEGKRIDTLRKADSTMPVNRYFAEYLPPVEKKIESPFLGELTAQWVKNLVTHKNILPCIADSIKVHKLMFDWLNKSKTHKDIFPIT